MKLIVCIDDKNGMMFNNRRQSRDKILIANLLEYCKGKKLYTTEYSAKLFPENTVEVCAKLEEITEGYIFAENILVNENEVEEIIVYKWNRLYPADTYFNIDLANWALVETTEFAGSSHEKITREVYERCDNE